MPSCPKPVRNRPRKASKNKCMDLAKKICRVNGICLSCGQPTGLHHEIEAAHIVPCRFWNVAADTWNLIPLGHSCHSYFTAHPKEFEEFVDRIYPGRRMTLYAIARVKKAIEWDVVWEKLVGEAKVAGIL